MRICIIDDESAVRSGIIFKLNSLNKSIEVFDAGFGHDALDKVRSIRPEIIITDIMMPGLDGLELLQIVKAELPAARVYLLTGYSEFEYARKAIHLGAMGYLLKPADPEELLKLVTAAQQEEMARIRSDFLRMNELLKERSIQLELIELVAPGAWYDESVPKRIEFVSDPAAAPLEHSVLVFKYKRNLYGVVVQTGWNESRCFSRGDQFVSYFLRDAEQWESEQFFAASEIRTRKAGEWQLKQSAELRLSILQAVKDQHIQMLEQQVSRFLQHIGSFELKQLRKECAYLMAALDETMTAKHDIAIVEEDKLVYWTSWVTSHTSWAELNNRLERFVLGGIKALAELEAHQPPSDLVERAMQLVHRYKAADINLESVAAALSIHSVTLSRIFKQQTGENFVRYAVRHRLKLAERLLLQSDKKVGDIAEEVGYTDYRYFSHLFKQVHGVSPMEFRKRHSRSEH
ncbi:response regulator [Paenibacillus sp. NPDC056579]|uniref:response regulator transcription factor n=1 Tax=Paenibacillus sp. NPDC056579 TaxID=3345871 RepID=UPI00367B7FA6